LREETAPSILEIGTGSGCIVISLLHKVPDAQATATDISAAALRVAQRNAERHKANTRLELIEADGFPSTPREFSLIVSNPPYVAENEFSGLQPEVRDYEPRSALVSGADGLAHIGMLLRDAPGYVRSGGHLIFEIGFRQHEAVERMINQEVWQLMEVRKDLQGIPRTFVLRRR
jgi:release factor glutamine methyltransferase